MPRRASNRVITPSSTTYQSPSVVSQPPSSSLDSNITQLRRQWRWAAFSQFFFTFNALFAVNDITLTDIENDLVYSTNRILSQVVQRLLITLTQDRKISVDSWQTALRRQYLRRNPDANPIGPLEHTHSHVVGSSRASTIAPAHSHGSSEVPTIKEPDDEVAQLDFLHGVPAMDELSSRVGDSVEDYKDPTFMKVEDKDFATNHSQRTQKQINWLELPMPDKLKSLHTLVEWQFQNPLRLRSQMKDDDENAQWRIEPIGYDAKRNAYWLIGADRLWIQRELPRVSAKRKRKTPLSSTLKKPDKKLQDHSVANKRRRVDGESIVTGLPPWVTLQSIPAVPVSRSRGSRAAKARANEKLDAQAKDLAEFQRQISASSRTSPRSSKANTQSRTLHRPAGIRLSARLRGAAALEDEWQEIPEEWLNTEVTAKDVTTEPPPDSSSEGKHNSKSGLENDDDSISDLTELSDDESQPTISSSEAQGKSGGKREEIQFDKEPGTEESAEAHEDPNESDHSVDDEKQGGADPEKDHHPHLPEDFIEWETICITLEDWEEVAHRFENATHYAEKALHKVLSQSIVPIVTAELREAERNRRMEEAVVHRKRSSRIALRELEKEEERLARKRHEEQEEKMSRTRRFEARQRKEEAERLKRENAREQRRRERELREQGSAEEQETELKAEALTQVDNQAPGSSTQPTSPGNKFVPSGMAALNGGSGSRTPAESWELDCEICHTKGLNRDDGVPVMCCSVCSKWQHIPCHDKRDASAGRPKRNWDAEEFICQSCRLPPSKALPTDNGVVHRPHVYTTETQPLYLQHYHPSLCGRLPYENQSEVRSSASLSPQTYSQQPRLGSVMFAHYQPEGGNFSTSRPTYSAAETTRQQGQHAHQISCHPVPGAGVNSYPTTFQAHPAAPLPSAYSREQWQHIAHPAAPLNTNSMPAHHTPGIDAYYANQSTNGNPQPHYSQVRGRNQASGHYGLHQARPYQLER